MWHLLPGFWEKLISSGTAILVKLSIKFSSKPLLDSSWFIFKTFISIKNWKILVLFIFISYFFYLAWDSVKDFFVNFLLLYEVSYINNNIPFYMLNWLVRNGIFQIRLSTVFLYNNCLARFANIKANLDLDYIHTNTVSFLKFGSLP